MQDANVATNPAENTEIDSSHLWGDQGYYELNTWYGKGTIQTGAIIYRMQICARPMCGRGDTSVLNLVLRGFRAPIGFPMYWIQLHGNGDKPYEPVTSLVCVDSIPNDWLGLSVYPNAASSTLYAAMYFGTICPARIDLADAPDYVRSARVTVYDIAGRQVMIPFNADRIRYGYHLVPIDVSGWANGTYALHLTTADGREARRVFSVVHGK